MNQTAIWTAAQEAAHALSAQYGPVVEQAVAASGLTYAEWSTLFAALTFAPEPTSSAQLRVRSPYTSARLFETRLADMASRGFMLPVAEAHGE